MHISLLQICCNLSIILYFFLVYIPIIHIQWGRRTELTIYDNYKYEESFPIAFDQKCIGVLVTLEGRGPVSGASVAYTDNRSLTEFTIVADASNAVAKSDLFYIAIGA